jgi:hypothetical protein
MKIRKTKKIFKWCEWCRKDYYAYHPAVRYCSYECRDAKNAVYGLSSWVNWQEDKWDWIETQVEKIICEKLVEKHDGNIPIERYNLPTIDESLSEIKSEKEWRRLIKRAEKEYLKKHPKEEKEEIKKIDPFRWARIS